MEVERSVIMPAGIMAEVTYMIERFFGSRKLEEFLQSLLANDIAVDWHHADLERVVFLVNRYSDLPLGYADAAVVACAERLGGRVATLDTRHFGVVAREGTITIVN